MLTTLRYKTVLLGAVAGGALLASPVLAVPLPSSSVSVTSASGVVTTDSQSVPGTTNAYQEVQEGDNRSSALATARSDYVTTANSLLAGTGAGEATAGFTDTITNTTTGVVDYYMVFRIFGGYLQLSYDSPLTLDSTDVAAANLLSAVAVNGSNIWSLDLGLALSDGVYSISDDETDDSGVLDGFSSYVGADMALMSWYGTDFRVFLGTLAPQASLTLDYMLYTDVSASFVNACIPADDGDIGVASFNVTSTTYGGSAACYHTLAVASDPGQIDPVLGIEAQPRATGVPEPATLALMGVGLAGLGLGRRRLRRA